MSLTSLVIVAAEAGHSEPAVPAWAVGAITLVILLALLGILMAFGGGREHS